MEYALYKCRLPIDGLGLCKAREAYDGSLRFSFLLRLVLTRLNRNISINLK